MYGGYRVVALGASPGQFFSFLTAFLLAYEPAKRLARLNIDLNSNLVGARKLLEIVDSPATEPADDDKPALKLNDARIELRDVTFAYRPSEPVLHRMSFIAEPGKTTALVGPSGGGKSTVLALLLRLYEVNDGAILIDGQAISGVSRHSLRQQTGYVGQDVYLFRDTIGANIALRQGRRHARTRSWPRPRPPAPMISSWASRSATTPRSASTARNCPAASASASRWPAR